MAKHPSPQDEGKSSGARHLVASLRLSRSEMAQKEAVRVLYPESSSETDLALRIWRRGLQLDLARLLSVGGVIPGGVDEQQVAMLVLHDVLTCLPLLQRTGRLHALIALLAHPPLAAATAEEHEAPGEAPEIDPSAAGSIDEIGGGDFL
ncbi:MAG: hypothetical protein EI684_04350 [Candidatus Viridilinea halotolerans]|uniref:Uncharacterized protein n=1 Tax=Candidatus Viridilinea halotolerans TaxID=2491704 RepID=A0A426U6I8_9CHLR|nr:MAG: hypothetical protein EI684_04350 [Candidatus Viridilinea halotolerans]